MISIAPTNRTAALAGAWCAVGAVAHEAWEKQHATASVASQNISFLFFAIVFLVVPAYFFVVGHGSQPFSRTWFVRPEERGRYVVLFKRLFSWFLAAAVVMSLSSLLFK